MMNDLFLLSKRHEGYFTESDLHRCIHTVSMVTRIAADALKYCELNSHCKNLMVTWVSRLFITTERYNLVKLYFRSIIEFSWRWRAPEVAGPRGDGPPRWRAPEAASCVLPSSEIWTCVDFPRRNKQGFKHKLHYVAVFFLKDLSAAPSREGCCSPGGRVGHLLTERLVVWCPAAPVYKPNILEQIALRRIHWSTSVLDRKHSHRKLSPFPLVPAWQFSIRR